MTHHTDHRVFWRRAVQAGGVATQDSNFQEISRFLSETEEYLNKLAHKVAMVSA